MSPQKNVYILVGPPGSGKGTVSHLCAKTMDWIQLSTGNLCRKHIAEQTEIGKQIDFALKSGKLVSDSLINDMVHDWFIETIQNTDHIILDGYPRTVVQAQTLHHFLQQRLPDLSVNVVRFFISDEEVIARICGRLVCQNKDCQAVYSLNAVGAKPLHDMKCDACGAPLGRRNDDALAAARDRLITYHKHEQDLLDFYKSNKFEIKELHVAKQLNEVFEEFKKLVGYSGI